MPTPRRSRPSTPISTPKASSVDSPADRTPTAHHHHKTADELAAEEAASLLTPTTRLRSAVSAPDPLENGSARALRHRRLNEVREETEHKKDKEEEASTASTSSRGSREKSTAGENEGDDTSEEPSVAHYAPGVEEESLASTQREEVPEPLSAGSVTAETLPLRDDGKAESSASGSESESDDESSMTSDSDSDSGSGSDTSETDESDSDEEDERMEKLLAAARVAAIAKQSSSIEKGESKAAGTSGDDEEAVLQFDEDQKERRPEAPIPDLSVPKLPKAHLSFTQDGRALAVTELPSIDGPGPSKRPIVGRKSEEEVNVPELDDRPYERELSKREKASQPRKATTSELWASIPTPRSDMLPQMKRDYQALALANSLDPKRFMKGGSKSDKVPESFAIGSMVDAPRHLQATTLTKEKKYRAGEVVSGLIKDDDMGDYAKRKYGDLQWTKMENGRGKERRKRSKW